MGILWLMIGIVIGLGISAIGVVLALNRDQPVGFLIERRTGKGKPDIRIKMDRDGYDKLKTLRYARFIVEHEEEIK